MGKITFERDPETGLLKAYKYGQECGTIICKSYKEKLL